MAGAGVGQHTLGDVHSQIAAVGKAGLQLRLDIPGATAQVEEDRRLLQLGNTGQQPLADVPLQGSHAVVAFRSATEGCSDVALGDGRRSGGGRHCRRRCKERL